MDGMSDVTIIFRPAFAAAGAVLLVAVTASAS